MPVQSSSRTASRRSEVRRTRDCVAPPPFPPNLPRDVQAVKLFLGDMVYYPFKSKKGANKLAPLCSYLLAFRRFPEEVLRRLPSSR